MKTRSKPSFLKERNLRRRKISLKLTHTMTTGGLMKKILLIVAILILVLYCERPAQATILFPNADATIFDFGPKDGIPDFINHSGLQAFNVPFGDDRALLEFNLSSLSGTNISSAILDLDVADTLGPYPMTLGIYTYSGDGIINNDDFGAGSLWTTYNYNGENNVLLDLTGAISNQVNASQTYAGINIRGQNVSALSNAPYVAFHNTDNPRAALLRINETSSVPEPTSLLLFLSGAGLIYLSRKNKRHFKNFLLD